MRGIWHVLYRVHIFQDVAQVGGSWICWYIRMNIEITHNDKMFNVSVALQISGKLVKEFIIRKRLRRAVDNN